MTNEILVAECLRADPEQKPGAALLGLIAALERKGGGTGPVTEGEIRDVLESVSLGLEDVCGYVRADPEKYSRCRVIRTDRYEVLVFCWLGGQRSSVHDHTGSACGVRVVSGTATEVGFVRTPGSELAVADRVSRLDEGDVTASFDSDIHRIQNDGVDELVTLHVYSPPLEFMRTYAARE